MSSTSRLGSVYKRKGAKYWSIQFYDQHGKRRNVTSGTTDEREARRQLKQINRRVKIGADLPSGLASQTPLRASLLKILSEQVRSGRKTEKTGITDLTRLLRFSDWCESHAIRTVEAVTVAAINEFSEWLIKTRNLQPSTASRYVGLITGVLPHKVKVNRYTSGRKIGKEIPSETLMKILSAVEPTFRAFLILLAETGLRTGHLCKAETEWIKAYEYNDQTRNFLVFPTSASNKIKNAPLVPLNENAMEVIDRLECKGLYLFDDGTFKPMFTKDRVIRRWQYWCGKLGISGYRPYDLRHTWAIREIMRTGDISYVSRVLGHSSPRTTLEYYQNLSTARIIERNSGSSIVGDISELFHD